MNTKIFLSIHGLAYTLFGLIFLLFPNIFFEKSGNKLNEKYAFFLLQHTTIFLGGIVVLIPFYKDFKDNPKEGKKILMVLLQTNIIGDIITSFAIIKSIFFGFAPIDPIVFVLLFLICLIKLGPK